MDLPVTATPEGGPRPELGRQGPHALAASTARGALVRPYWLRFL